MRGCAVSWGAWANSVKKGFAFALAKQEAKPSKVFQPVIHGIPARGHAKFACNGNGIGALQSLYNTKGFQKFLRHHNTPFTLAFTAWNFHLHGAIFIELGHSVNIFGDFS